MAMIKCSECGKSISDKASNCPNCGNPIDLNGSEKIQKVEISKVNVKPKITKKTIIIIISIITLIAVALGIIYSVNNSKKEADSLLYSTNLGLASSEMLIGAIDAESCGNLIKSVWYNTIWEEKDEETDKYTRKNNGTGSFYDDFNDALSNLFNDEDFKSKQNDIRDSQKKVNSYMKDLKNPPEDMKDAYEALKEYYDAYLELTNLAINPSGNLQTYSNNFNSADTKVSNAYSKFQQYLDY